MDRCDDPELFESMIIVVEPTRVTSWETPFTSRNTVRFPETDQTARPVGPTTTAMPIVTSSTGAQTPPNIVEGSIYPNPAQTTQTQHTQIQSTQDLQTDIQGYPQPVTEPEDGSTHYIGGSGTIVLTHGVDVSGTTQDTRPSENFPVSNVPYVESSRGNDDKSMLRISTPAGIIIGTTVALVIVVVIAFTVYRSRRFERRTKSGSQERLVSNS
ncbi:hypothetical protein CPB86DRAFT_780116 [Serendipita vermifera]|nr:hypothetical protein CPB86DRAFT_780116 [Serendipita vermifera]